jgi:ribosome maturation factor RimP
MGPQLEQIQQLAQRIVQSEGLDLIDVEFKLGKSRDLLRVYIDKQGGVTLSDCENISYQLSAALDVQDIMKNAYVLEVSSPGVDRPLKTDRDYGRAVGRLLKLHVAGEEGKTEQVVGKLIRYDDREVVVETKGQERSINRDVVKRAQQEIELGQPKKDSKKRK